MAIAFGVFLSLVALVAWGVGDFLIQRTTRLVGSAKALFFIGVVAFVALLPFVFVELPHLTVANFTLLATLSVVVILGAAFDFEALRKGKIAVIEPVVGLELPMTVIMTVIFLGESFTPLQIFLMVLVFGGTALTVTRDIKHLTRLFEKGVLLAFLAAVGTALTSVMVGFSSQEISPLVSIWFSHGTLALVSGIVILSSGGMRSILKDIIKNPVTIGSQSVLDNVAWIAFAFAATMIPISIATTISGGYVALGVLLGIFVSREKVKTHQALGIAFVSIGVIVLSYFYG